MNRPTNHEKVGTQVFRLNRDIGEELEDYWDHLADDDKRLIWSAASGLDDQQIAADSDETPRAVAKQYRALLLRLGLDDRLSLVLAAVARTAQSSPPVEWA